MTSDPTATGRDRSALDTDDVDAFYARIEPHIDKMGRVAARLGGHANREDIVQDALLQAWKSRGQYDPARGSMSAWLLSITAHQATKVRRRVSRSTLQRGRDPWHHPDELVDLTRGLRALTPRQRLAVDCFYFVGLSVSETAGVMACSEGTVKSTLSSARERLREILR